MGSSARVLAVWAALAGPFCAPPARADVGPERPASEDDRERALSIGRNAIELFQQGNYHFALERFQSAERARHSPVFVLYIARSHARLGHLLEARSYYERVLAEQLPATSPAPWISARDDAALELRELEPRIPNIQIRVSGQSPVEVRLDGHVTTAREPEVVWVDPGEHELVASDARGAVTRRRFSVVEGERAKLVELSLELVDQGITRAPQAPAATVLATRAPRAPAPYRRPDAAPRSGGAGAESRVFDPVGIALLSAGTLGVVVGAVTGLLSLERTRAIEENCEGDHCLPEDADDGAAAERLAVASNVAFVVGGAAFATFGVRAWVLPPAAPARGPRQARLNFGISGRF